MTPDELSEKYLPLGIYGCESCKHTRLFCSKCIKKTRDAKDNPPVKLPQEYRSEIRDTIIDQIQSLQDVVGYHFNWCPAYLDKTGKIDCICGMNKLLYAKKCLNNQRLNFIE